MRHRTLPVVALLGVALITGCDALTTSGPQGTPVGIAILSARTKGTGYTTAPTVNFYRAANITFASAAATTDSCIAITFDPALGANASTATGIGGGAFVAIAVPGGVDTLRKQGTVDLTYRLASPVGLTFTPGDSISFGVPGDAAGFPTTSFTAMTAEAFTMGPIVIPPANQAMTVTWSAAPTPNSAMLVSLRFAEGTATTPNMQIFCDFRDDGTGTVQAALAARWAASTTRTVLTSRLRTAILRAEGPFDAFINMISTFDVPTPTSP